MKILEFLSGNNQGNDVLFIPYLCVDSPKSAQVRKYFHNKPVSFNPEKCSSISTQHLNFYHSGFDLQDRFHIETNEINRFFLDSRL